MGKKNKNKSKAQDRGWASYFRAMSGNRKAYDKYFEDGQLKQGYSRSGAIGGSQRVYSNKIRGEMKGTKDARYRTPSTTFSIYKLPQQQAAPAPAAAPAASSAAQNPLAINNPYKAEADRLLQTIKDMEDAKPKTMISSSQAVNPSNLTIAAAGEQPKQSGSGSFKRRKAATTTTANLRTINSVNI